MTKQKRVLKIAGPGSTHWVGDGFPVRNLFPSNGINDEVNPFLMFDYAGPREFAPTDRRQGVDEHPHRGFETVTIAYQGAVEHRDSAGNSGVIYPGDVQWMTAASGVVHEEKHEKEFAGKGGAFEMVQLWVNLPSRFKMSRPRYQSISKDQIPVVLLGSGSRARIIAGELDGVKGPAKTFSPVQLFDLFIKTGDKITIHLPEGHNAGVALLRGNLMINGSKPIDGEARMVALSPDGEDVILEASQDSTAVLLSGEAIDEPVASYGPFVMNTKEQLIQAFDDYRSGKMGHLN